MSLTRSIRTASRSLPTLPRLAPSATRYTHSVPTPSKPLQPSQPTEADAQVYQQSPNVAHTWSTSQMPKKEVYAGARFEQTALEMQPNSLSAQGMVSQDPVRMVNGRKATCDGGGGALGHPKIFINLDKPGPKACGYCGIRFEQVHDAHH